MKKILLFSIITLLIFSSFAQADTELPLTATASSYRYSDSPNRTVDNNLFTRWRGAYYEDFWWLRLDCGNSYNLSQISIWWDSRYGARDYDIQSSPDGNYWTNLYTGLSSVGSVPQTYTLSVTARFVRIYIKQQVKRSPRIYEVKIFAGAVANQPPSAQAIASTTSGVAPLDVDFTGSGQDLDGTIVGYSWNFGDGNTSTEQSPNHTYNNSGTYVAALTVTDNEGATGTDTVSIKVDEPANQSPTAQISANPTEGDVPLEVNFSGSGQDPDGTIVSYSWNFGDGGSSGQQSLTYPYNSAGTYIATLTVTDDDGATASDSVTIKVDEPANQSPTAQATFSPGETPLEVNFSGSGQDPDGTIISYYWEFGDGEVSYEQNPVYTYSNPGTYIVILTVTDDDGATASASVEVTVDETPEAPAEIPQLIRFQARLEDAQGTALDGTFSVTFRLYETNIGGTPLWEEIQDAYVEEGVLDVKLGSVSTLDLPFDKQYWLGVEVGSDGEMSPRFEFTSVPYSLKSAQ